MKFSVLMSVYRNDDYKNFERALFSVIDAQTLRPDEVVLVVDGPVGDDINEVISKYENTDMTSFKTVRLEENVGLGNALRAGCEAATYDIIARMDSDDVAVNDRFEKQLALFDDETDIIGGDISEFIDSEDNVVSYRKVPTTDEEIKKYLKVRCPFNHMTVVFRKKTVLDAGGYMDLRWNEDYYLWIRMAEIGAKMKNTGTVLVNVRVGADMYKRRGGRKYFKSEKYLQNYMLEKNIIDKKTYRSNVIKRWIVQVLCPNFVRGWVFKKFARS